MPNQPMEASATPTATVLARPPSNYVAGRWLELPASTHQADIRSLDPSLPQRTLWQGSPNAAHLEHALDAARAAQPAWEDWGLDRRAAVLRRYGQVCTRRAGDMASLIADETGKALWDATQEASALVAKVDITLDRSELGPLRRVSAFDQQLASTRVGRTWFRPHGVMAVVAPFNFPAHLANGHIVPALAMGNTVVLKPSEKTPAVGQLLAEFFAEALEAEGAPPGVLNVVQGRADIARTLVADGRVDGVLFTGSWSVGRRIMEANLDRPSRILALEMGGSNATVVLDDADLRQAAIEVTRSAFVTTGQRCTCTRRLILHRPIAARMIAAIAKAASNVIVGPAKSAHPVFMGPIISAAMRDEVLAFQGRAAEAGARVIVPSTALDHPSRGYYITPGIMQVERFRADASVESSGPFDPAGDGEIFGPMLRVCVVDTLDEAIEQANATRFGLAAAIFTTSQASAERFLRSARAGCINVNTGTAGASSRLPFGGLGLSGNHRPAGSFSLDYCAYPVAGMLERSTAATLPQGMRFEDNWL